MRRLGIMVIATTLVACGSSAPPKPRDVASEPVAAVRPPAPPAPEPICIEHEPTTDVMQTIPAPHAFTELEAAAHARWDTPGKYVYTGAVADVLGDGRGKKGSFQLDAAEAIALAKRIDTEVVEPRETREWAGRALLLEAEIFERLRTGLSSVTVYNGPDPVPPGQVRLLTLAQRNLLIAMQNQMRPGLNAQAGALQAATEDFWIQKKRQELDGVEEVLIRRYIGAALLGESRAIRRLAQYTRELGNRTMKKYVEAMTGPVAGQKLVYVPNMYVDACARLVTPPPAER